MSVWLLCRWRPRYNPLVEEWTPHVPAGRILDFGAQDADFVHFEKVGAATLQNAAFVLVAGGRGERLGYDGIKVSLPVQLLTETTYLQHFVENILGFQQLATTPSSTNEEQTDDEPTIIPLAIMTSADTHDDTLRLLEANDYFGAAAGQIVLMQQDLVPSLLDNNGTLATAAADPFTLAMKPHGVLG